MTDTSKRQLRLGAILEGVGIDQNGWRDPGVQGNASVNIDWYIENARLATTPSGTPIRAATQATKQRWNASASRVAKMSPA